MYTYEFYNKEDFSNDFYNLVRQRHHLDGQDCVLILCDGRAQTITGEIFAKETYGSLDAAAQVLMEETKNFQDSSVNSEVG